MRKITKRQYSLLVIAVAFTGLSACNKSGETSAQQSPATTVAADSNPDSGNLAPVQQPAPYAQPSASYAQQPAPAPSQVAGNYQPAYEEYPPDSGYDASVYQQTIETTEPPPPLPEYDQPPCPGDNYYWTPGYWAWADAGYYWVPGAWVLVPWIDALWTPPYWDYDDDDGYYVWHAGYWGPHIGFYGDIDYGFGYTGRGYYGAYWDHDRLHYNRNVMNVDPVRVHDVYSYPVPRGTQNRVSYNGGRGGISARPTPQELAVVHDPRTPPVTAQVQHAREAAASRAQFAAVSRNRPERLVAPAPLPTHYNAPAPTPPAAAMRAAARPAGMPPGQPAPRNEAPRPQLPGQQQPANAGRPAPEVRQAQPNVNLRPEILPGQPGQQGQPGGSPRPEARPLPPGREARPTPPPIAARPAPGPQQEARPTLPPAAPRPVPPAREARPAPPPVAARPAPRPQQEARPTPPPAARRPAPPARENRPAPPPAAAQPAPRPQQEARPAPSPAAAPPAPPAREARPAPAAARPAPRPQQEARPAPTDKNEKKEH